MAKLVKFTAADNQAIYVNAEAVRAVLPKGGGNSMIVYGDLPHGSVEVKGDPASVHTKMIS